MCINYNTCVLISTGFVVSTKGDGVFFTASSLRQFPSGSIFGSDLGWTDVHVLNPVKLGQVAPFYIYSGTCIELRKIRENHSQRNQ